MRATPAAAIASAAVLGLTCIALLSPLRIPDALAQSVVAPGPLSEVLADGAAVEKVAGGYKFTEGPVYDKEKNVLLFSDQPNSTISRYDPKTGRADVFRALPVVPNGNTFDREGRLITCEHRTRRVSRTDRDGRIVTLAYEFEGKRLNSPNDLALHSSGALYFTDPPWGIKPEQAELGYNALWRLAPDGSLSKLSSDFGRPNGIAFSPDEKALYVNDDQRANIRAFDVQPDGTLTNDRIFAEVKGPDGRGGPDGMKVDARGTIFCTGPGGVWVFRPDGTKVGVVEVPETPANCAFGDRDGKTLYITARTSLYKVRLRHPGSVPGRR